MSRRRRGRGEGAIYQRGDAIWTGNVSLGYSEDGRRKRRVVYGKSKQEVQEKLRELQNDASSGVLADPGKMTLGEFLRRWLESTHRPVVQPTTYAGNEPRVRLHLIPHLGRVRLTKLVPLHVEQLYVDMERAGDSPHERHKCGKILRAALRHAVALGQIPNNPAALVPLPKIPKRQMQVYDAADKAPFLRAATDDQLFAMYLLALDTGMRQGELFALQW